MNAKFTLYAATAALLLCLPPPALAQSGLTFKDYDCLDDCSGHKAGYDWAQKKAIELEEDCGGNSTSFIEGCKAWVEEQHQSEIEEDRYFTFPDEGVTILE